MSDEPQEGAGQDGGGHTSLSEGIEAEVKQDVEKAKGGQPKRPWWKVGRT
jgi:hypothetical protein